MLYWERLRRRIAHQQSLPASLLPYAGKASQPSTMKQVPFPHALSLPPDITPPLQYSPSSAAIAPTHTMLMSSTTDRVSGLGDRTAFGERTHGTHTTRTLGVVGTPVTPPLFTSPLDRANKHLLPMPTEKMGQMYCFVPKSPTTTFYQPVIIPGMMEKKGHHRSVITIAHPPRPKRLGVMVHMSMLCLCLFVFMSVLMIVSPVGDDERVVNAGWAFQPSLRLTTTKSGASGLAWLHIATATAVTQDGYDPGGGDTISYPYVNTTPLPASASDAVHLNRFFVGQCTYWANMRYHQLTGHWIPWLGNASAWAYQALNYGWVVANRPNPHDYSIMVMQPQVAGAGLYGHVAVVEHIGTNNTVYTSNWNWHGGWHTTQYVTFMPQQGISFIWFP